MAFTTEHNDDGEVSILKIRVGGAAEVPFCVLSESLCLTLCLQCLVLFKCPQGEGEELRVWGLSHKLLPFPGLSS